MYIVLYFVVTHFFYAQWSPPNQLLLLRKEVSVLLWLFLCKQLNAQKKNPKQEVGCYWEWRNKPNRKRYHAISNTKACPHLTYPMPTVWKNKAEQKQGESSEVGRAPRQPGQGSPGGEGVIQCNYIKSGVARWGQTGISHNKEKKTERKFADMACHRTVTFTLTESCEC